MSRLTSRAPFNRSFDVSSSRPVPLSPPETEMESMLQEPRQDPNSTSPEAGAPMTTDSPAGHFRRVSNIAYTSSTLLRREPRSAQRQPRWLVTVVPPASLTQEPPTLGHTLSSAPTGRFANGILMPLFPTLYGQLAAIAREFNMPSTTGLCIYLHLAEPGASTLTPRISDESWPLLWGQFFNGDEGAAQLPPHGLPISGRIEFDIDLKRAKWFDAWMGHPRRERGEVDLISREPSVAPTHWRGDSRTSLFPAETGLEELLSHEANPSATVLPPHTTAQRQLPRPLLLERRGLASVMSFSRHTSRAPSISHSTPSPDEPIQVNVAPQAKVTSAHKALSPVTQEQEPQTARQVDLQKMVHQWRENSSVTGASNALSVTGQPSLDPVNMPSGTDVELDLNDFAWSISSAGPPSESPLSPVWSEPLPSVHLLGRLQGSVCLTPSIATSFGPLDSDGPDSPVSCVSRRPSPDLGMRMLDHVPLTPTTATSWGPDDTPSSTHSEYEFEYRAPSVDIGVRGMGSRPVTPSTATSWGPADSPLLLPPSPPYFRTPDVGERMCQDLETSSYTARPSVFPYYSAWETQPWGHVWPYQTHRRRDDATITLSAPVRRTRNKTLLPEWPDFAALYPPDSAVEQAAVNKSQPIRLQQATGYPFLEVYPAAYPYNLDEIYPVSSVNKSQPISLQWATECPLLEVYPTAYPYNLDEIYPVSSKVQGEVVRGSQPEAISPILVESPSLRGSTQGYLLPQWPDFASLYPSGFRADRAAANKSQSVTLSGQVGYPYLEIYPTVYPYNLEQIYPVHGSAMDRANQENQISVSRSGGVGISRHRQPPGRIDFTLHSPTDSKVERDAPNRSLPVALQHAKCYPNIVVYETVYPYHLDELYALINSMPRDIPTPTHRLEMPVSSHLLSKDRDLYLSGLPVERASANGSQPVCLPTPGYPFLSVYPSVYPWSLKEIYGPTEALDSFVAPRNNTGSNDDTSVRIPVYSGYPLFNLYPAPVGYPTFELYPPLLSRPLKTIVTSSKLIPAYPTIEIYEPVYPHLIIYPQLQFNVVEEPDTLTAKDVRRSQKPRLTHLDLHNRVFKAASSSRFFEDQETQSPNPILRPRKTHHELHLMVFSGRSSKAVHEPQTPEHVVLSELPPTSPLNDGGLYGPPEVVDAFAVSPSRASSSGDIYVRLPVNSGYPTFNLYPASSGYPTFEIYPSHLPNSPVTRVPLSKLIIAYPTMEIYEPVYPNLIIYPQTRFDVVQTPPQQRMNSPRKRAPTPGPGHSHSRGLRSPPSPEQEVYVTHRSSRSPVEKDLAIPPLPTAAIKDISQRPSSPEEQERKIPISAKGHRKAHHELHLMVAIEPTQEPLDTVAELSHHSHVPSHDPVQQRSRTDGVNGWISAQQSQQVSQEDDSIKLPLRPPSPYPLRHGSKANAVRSRDPQPSRSSPELPPPLPPMMGTRGALPRSTSLHANSLSEVISTVESTPRPLSSARLLASRSRSPSISTTLSPAVKVSSNLKRVRSMNTPVRAAGAASDGSVVNDLDRLRLSPGTNLGGGNRQSIVVERAKTFTMSEKGVEVSNTLPPTAKPVSKLDRSKIPFA